MPTLAPPVFDNGGSRAQDRAAPGLRPLKIGLAFVGALIVTVVVLRLILGPFGGTDDADPASGSSTSAPQADAAPPSASVARPGGVQLQPDTLAAQYVRERLTAPPGESPALLAERLGVLLAPEYAWVLAGGQTVPDAPGSLVEVGEPTVVEPGAVEVPAQPWTYGSDPAVATPADPQVWRVEVREEQGVWSVTDARPV
jgi:hypothetical protein